MHEETKQIDQAFIQYYVHDYAKSDYFIVGSESMVEAISTALIAMGVPSAYQHSEVFPGY